MITTTVISSFVPAETLAELDPAAMAQLVSDLADGARAKWIQLAGQRLSSSRRDYINGIQKVQLKGLTASIELVGMLPNMVENGASAYDMHQTLLGPAVPISSAPGQRGKKQAADGHFYRAIPFRHQTPGSAGQGGGPAMGSAYEGHPAVKNAGALGKAIHKKAKLLSATTGHPGTGVSYGGRLPGGLAPKLKTMHSSDIYAGMIRQEKTYAAATQSTYTTFRMISDAVPDKWQHPGIEAANLAQEVEDFVGKLADAALGELFK